MSTHHDEFVWQPQPEAAELIDDLLRLFQKKSQAIDSLAARMLRATGTRLVDWVDHLVIDPAIAFRQKEVAVRLQETGFVCRTEDQQAVWRHNEGMFPAVVTSSDSPWQLAVRVDSVEDYLVSQRLDCRTAIEGDACSQVRKAMIDQSQGVQLWVIERHGSLRLIGGSVTANQLQAVIHHREAFRRRQREFATDAEGFDHASRLIDDAVTDLGVDWTCDLFFAAERKYWQIRNHAAKIQKARQDYLGLGWANHDHHTYRSSRKTFPDLIDVLEKLGFTCRERFYAGQQAGWGAQVLEQPKCSILVFADVDLTPEEVAGDFAHQGLAPRDQLGTVGLWCQLHGEAFLQAGLHHLECQFDFSEVTHQLAEQGVSSMAPFTDVSFLKQAFTEGETWQVDESRIASALSAGYIDQQQAERFRNEGAIGSHLEILERNVGYKGFNQTGISEIIQKTDPRRIQLA